MITRKAFLGRAGGVVAGTALGGVDVEGGEARNRRSTDPSVTLTEVLADGRWHTVTYAYTLEGLRYVMVGGLRVLWRREEQPPGEFVALETVYNLVTTSPSGYVLSAGDWRLYRNTVGRLAVEVEAPTGFGVWAGAPRIIT